MAKGWHLRVPAWQRDGDRGHGRGMGTVGDGRARGQGTQHRVGDPGRWHSTGTQGSVPACPPSAPTDPPQFWGHRHGGVPTVLTSSGREGGDRSCPRWGQLKPPWCHPGVGEGRDRRAHPLCLSFPNPPPPSLGTPWPGKSGGTHTVLTRIGDSFSGHGAPRGPRGGGSGGEGQQRGEGQQPVGGHDAREGLGGGGAQPAGGRTDGRTDGHTQPPLGLQGIDTDGVTRAARGQGGH